MHHFHILCGMGASSVSHLKKRYWYKNYWLDPKTKHKSLIRHTKYCTIVVV